MTPTFGPALRQPDQRSCGAACVVVARMLDDGMLEDGSAGRDDRRLAAAFALQVLEAHRRLTGLGGITGRTQLPWPRALGTPPWAVAGALGAIHGVDYRSSLARWDRSDAFDRALTAAARHPVALYVGSPMVPRHVVLAVSAVAPGTDALRCYDPASGRLVTVTRQAFADATLRLGGWPMPWFVVAPR